MGRHLALVAGILAIAPVAARAQSSAGTQTFGAKSSGAQPYRNVPRSELPELAQGKRAEDLMTDPQLLRALHHIDQEEIDAGHMAEKKGSTKQVKDYGRMLVQDHEKADEQVRQVADEMHVELRIDKDDRPQTVLEHDQEQQRKMEQLQRLSGKVFDLTFAQLMSNGHQHAIDIVKNAEPTRRGDLKNLLDTLLPVLQKHKDVADQILRTVGNTASAK